MRTPSRKAKKDIFITSTLKSEWNTRFNPRLCAELEQRGLSCFLPQREIDQKGAPSNIFESNVAAIRACKLVVGVGMNESPNLGAEVGFARGIDKPILILTDRNHEIPLMIEGMAGQVFVTADPDEIPEYIERFVVRIKNLIKQRGRQSL